MIHANTAASSPQVIAGDREGSGRAAAHPVAAGAATRRRRQKHGANARDGVFATVDEAVNAAYEAQKKVAAMSLEDRGRMIDIICRICNDRREELGRMELEETKVGRLDHKIQKLTNMRFVLGVEAMRSDARSNTTGLCIIERAPWGVIGMVLPVTHSVPTMAANAINILAAGNTAVFGPHPSGARGGAVCAATVQSRDRARAGRGRTCSPRPWSRASKLPSRSSIIRRLRCCADGRPGGGEGGGQIRQARDRGRAGQSSGGGG